MENKTFLSIVSKSFLLQEFIPCLEVRNFIACQFALESNFGSSNLAVLHGNLCGMKVPHVRFSYRDGSKDGFCTYSTWYDCYKDYLMWIFYNRPNQYTLENLDSFKLFLRDSGYCPEKGYIQRIELIYNQYFLTSKN